MAKSDKRAFQQKIRELQPWLRRFARRLVKDESLSEDIVQETLILALKSPPRSK